VVRKKGLVFQEKDASSFYEFGLSLSGEAEAKTTRRFLLRFFKKEVLPSHG
jgi:hypothetical protein